MDTKREVARRLIMEASARVELEDLTRQYDGKCRYCGSPTVKGRHSWGWTACKNYRRPKGERKET